MFHVCILSPCILYPAVLDIKISRCEVSRFWTCSPSKISNKIPVFEELEGVAEEEEEDADDNDWFIQADDVY